jgi:magnesium transporter
LPRQNQRIGEKELELEDLRTLRKQLEQRDAVALAAEFGHLEPGERAKAFRLLGKDKAMAVFQLLDAAHQEELLQSLRDEQVRHLVESLDPDDRARLFDEMPAAVTRKLLAGLSPAEQRMTATLLGYPEESAGRIMTPEFVHLRPEMTVAAAIDHIRRRAPGAETIYVLPVTDQELRLRGVVELKHLLLAAGEETVGSLMNPEARFVRADEDQEAAVRLLQAADLLAIPVVDSEKRLLGLITVDDAMDVLLAEESEDLARAGGAEPLGRPYFSVSILELVRSRVTWLLVLVLAAVLTVHVLNIFEETLRTVATLALFIPLLLNTGGNCGAQSATTMVRALATGEVRLSDLLRVIGRESMAGLLLGAVLGLLSLGPVWWFAGRPIAMVVALTLLTVCTLATLMGSLLPLLARRVGVDPAVASAPFVTTFVDAVGLVGYFLIARLVLDI